MTPSDINKQIDAYLEDRPLKQHEVELLKIMSLSLVGDGHSFTGRILDVGCASGSLLLALAQEFPQAEIVGIDVSRELIERAESRLSARADDPPKARVSVICVREQDYNVDKPFDAVIASGILSVFDDFAPPLERWLSWIGDTGRLFIFGRFNSRPVDTRIAFRNRYLGSKTWEGGLTAYSVETISEFLRSNGFASRFQRFKLAEELPSQEDPIRTYTVRCENGDILIANGANVLAEHFFVTAWAEASEEVSPKRD